MKITHVNNHPGEWLVQSPTETIGEISTGYHYYAPYVAHRNCELVGHFPTFQQAKDAIIKIYQNHLL